MRYLRQATATPIVIGPFLDKTDGVTPETGLAIAIAAGMRLFDEANPGGPTIPGAACTHQGGGFYSLTLPAIAGLGGYTLEYTDASTNLPVWEQIRVLPAAVFDALMSNTGAGILANTGALAGAVWDELLANHTVTGSFGLLIGAGGSPALIPITAGAVSRTVAQLRHAAALRVRDLWTGTLTAQASVGNTQLQDSTRIEVPGFFANCFIYIGQDATSEAHRLVNSGAGAVILANDGGIRVVRAEGTVYEIHRLLSVADYNAFITDAILSISTEAVLASIDHSALTITASATKPSGFENEYQLPAQFKYITEVWIEDSGGDFSTLIPMSELSIIAGTTKKLRFTHDIAARSFQAGKRIRILGQGPPGVPALSDTTAVTIDPDFIASYVEMMVLTPIAAGTGARAQAAAARVRTLTALVEAKRASAASEARVAPGSLVVPS